MSWDDLSARIATGAPLAVYLTQPDCGPCAAIKPRVRARLGTDPRWTLVEVDVLQDRETAGQLVVFTVPTLVLFVGGREVARHSRVIPEAALAHAATLAELAG